MRKIITEWTRIGPQVVGVVLFLTLRKQSRSHGTGGNHVIYGGATNYVTIDNFEIKNQAIQGGAGFGQADAIQFYGSNGSDIITNCYIHDFMTNGTLSASWSPDYSAGGVLGWVKLLNTTIDDTGGFGFNASSVKITGGMLGGACQNCAEVGNSKFVKTMAACFSAGSSHDNEFTGISQAPFDNPSPSGYAPMGSSRPHTQVIEDNAEGIGSCGGAKIYNNLIHDNSAGVTMLICYNNYVYNNVLWHNSNIAIMLGPPVPTSASNAGHFYNNTVDCSGQIACFGGSNLNFAGTINLKNNIWITNGTAISITGTIATSTNRTITQCRPRRPAITVSRALTSMPPLHRIHMSRVKPSILCLLFPLC